MYSYNVWLLFKLREVYWFIIDAQHQYPTYSRALYIIHGWRWVLKQSVPKMGFFFLNDCMAVSQLYLFPYLFMYYLPSNAVFTQINFLDRQIMSYGCSCLQWCFMVFGLRFTFDYVLLQMMLSWMVYGTFYLNIQKYIYVLYTKCKCDKFNIGDE